MRKERTWRYAASMVLGVLILAPAHLWSGTMGNTAPCLPPNDPNGGYTGGAFQYNIPGFGPIAIQGINFRFDSCVTPDTSLAQQTITFGSMVEGNLMTPTGSMSFLLPAVQSVLIGLLRTGGGGDGVPGGFDVFTTQLLRMDITFPGGVMVQIDPNPNTPSVGQATITNDGKGGFKIDSFFDIFTDLNLNGGVIPQSNGPTTMTFGTVPEPGTFLLLGAGCVALAGWRKRK